MHRYPELYHTHSCQPANLSVSSQLPSYTKPFQPSRACVWFWGCWHSYTSEPLGFMPRQKLCAPSRAAHSLPRCSVSNRKCRVSPGEGVCASSPSPSTCTAVNIKAKCGSCFLSLFLRAVIPSFPGPLYQAQSNGHLGFVSGVEGKMELCQKAAALC